VDTIANQLEHSVVALVAGHRTEALAALRAIDFRALVDLRTATRCEWRRSGGTTPEKALISGAKRQSTKRSDIRATFARDGYTCRYTHCRRQTVDLEVLKLLSRAFPDVLPYHGNWRPVEEHILYWTYSTSLEHIVPFPAGGTSDVKNLLTACYLCNDIKNCRALDLLGWTVGPPPESGWRGLTEYISELRKLDRPPLA